MAGRTREQRTERGIEKRDMTVFFESSQLLGNCRSNRRKRNAAVNDGHIVGRAAEGLPELYLGISYSIPAHQLVLRAASTTSTIYYILDTRREPLRPCSSSTRSKSSANPTRRVLKVCEVLLHSLACVTISLDDYRKS